MCILSPNWSSMNVTKMNEHGPQVFLTGYNIFAPTANFSYCNSNSLTHFANNSGAHGTHDS